MTCLGEVHYRTVFSQLFDRLKYWQPYMVYGIAGFIHTRGATLEVVLVTDGRVLRGLQRKDADDKWWTSCSKVVQMFIRGARQLACLVAR